MSLVSILCFNGSRRASLIWRSTSSRTSAGTSPPVFARMSLRALVRLPSTSKSLSTMASEPTRARTCPFLTLGGSSNAADLLGEAAQTVQTLLLGRCSVRRTVGGRCRIGGRGPPGPWSPNCPQGRRMPEWRRARGNRGPSQPQPSQSITKSEASVVARVAFPEAIDPGRRMTHPGPDYSRSRSSGYCDVPYQPEALARASDCAVLAYASG